MHPGPLLRRLAHGRPQGQRARRGTAPQLQAHGLGALAKCQTRKPSTQRAGRARPLSGRAAQRKRRHTYPELLRARRCRFVVFGLETGGRWSEEAATFLRLLAQARAASAPAAVRRATQAAWVHRWSGILSVAAQRAFAASLLELPPAAELGAAGDPPALHELLADARWLQAPINSRLPARTT